MEFRILGPFEVRDGGRIIELPRLQHRALLATLLLRGGDVSFDRLVEDLWGEDPPASARASLQNVVSHLRRTLGPDVLVTRPAGYRLDVEPERLDLHRFEQLVEAARLTTGEERVSNLRRGLALWRGPPLADLESEPFAALEIPRLEELETSAREDLVAAELALGLHAELVPQIEALVARHPLRERFRGQLMLALYRSDRQAEALEAYQETRTALVHKLGIEPSPALRALEQAILRQDRVLSLGEAAAVSLPAPPRALRRRATVLFAELAIAGEGVETVHRLGARALAEIRAAAEYHGGTVTRAAGDELVAVFGFPAAHEDDPLRAVRSALQLRRALETLNASLGAEDGSRVEARTAISTGELVVDAGVEPSGHAATLAKRLAETARPGEIMLDPATEASVRGTVVVEEAEPRAVRGRPGALSVFAATALRREPAAPAGAAAPLVGRGPELARLSAVVEEALADRRCRVAAVLGEPGIGKSRLAAELVAGLGDRALVLTGRCVSYGEGATFWPLADVISAAAGDDPRAAIAARLAGSEHAELVAERIAGLVGRTDVAGSTGEAFWAVRRFLEALAAERPVVLVFEDVHWAEATFLDLVEYLEQWTADVPLAVVCLARPELLEARPRWGAWAIELGPLGGDDASELVARADLPAEVSSRIVAAAGGNPLFAEQLAAHAAEDGADAVATVPPSLEALLSSRLDRLTEGERAVLERAAVVGPEFWHGAVLHLADPLDVPSVGRHLLELVRKGLIRPGRPVFPREDGFRFHHVLIRDVAYESMTGALRAELHERVADWLESQAPEQDELVGHHLEQAYRRRVGLGAPDRQARRLAADAGDRLAAAGLRAAKRGDVPAAANLLGRAAELLPPAEAVRRDVLAELGVVLWRAGDVQETSDVLSRSLATALAAGDRRAELRAGLELANLRLYRDPEGGADELLALAASAIPILQELGDNRALGRLWFATASVHGAIHCHYRASEQAATEALDSFRRSGWPPSACLQALAAALLLGPTPVEEGVRSCHGLLEEADLGGEANVLIFLAGLEAMRGRFDDARRLAARSRSLYEELGWTDRVTTNCAQVTAGIELLAGDAASAAAILGESCAVLQAGREQAHLATLAAQLGEALYRLGRYDEAARWADVSAERAASDDASAQFSGRALRAKLLARRGAYEDAEALGREAASLAAATDALGQRGDVLLDLAEVLGLAGRAEEAAREIEEALGLFERKGDTVSAARAARLLAERAPA